jgi:hypothetical protein
VTRIIEEREVTRSVKEREVTSIVCDRCGAECLSERGKVYERQGCRFEANFGWGSRFDDEQWEFDLCDECADWLTREIKGIVRT